MQIELLIGSILIGIVVGLVGIGGGILLFPMLVYLGYTVPQAVAISLFLNAIPNTLPGLYLYYKKGHFKVRPSIVVAIGTVVGSTIGSFIGSREYMDRKTIFRLYTLVIFVLSIYMFYFYCL